MRYIAVAVAAYLVDIGVFSLLYQSGMASLAVANIAGKICTAVFGFFVHRSVTFQLTSNHSIVKEAVKYFTVVILWAPLTTWLLLLLVHILPTATIAKIVADTIGVLASFTISKLFIFQKRPDSRDLPQA
ncbi:GtrA family protein [Tardiphaga sp. vice278]|uniref:GtrA family protein n=1 Tax=Tardiphaga sp. vice278 TaxID=2592815 RepID=UPI00143D6858|nr:GtrA family protein [Tardiphaga sp. vice278]